MKREIKFRAWDGDKKQMHVPEYSDKEDFHISAEGDILYTYESGYERHEQTSRRPNSWVLMQFTGLKDKNGKEIYEGDIVKYWMKVYEQACKAEIIFSPEILAFQIIYTGIYGNRVRDFLTHYQLEVIGNIYENKNLLP